jgi:hypothetical protein
MSGLYAELPEHPALSAILDGKYTTDFYFAKIKNKKFTEISRPARLAGHYLKNQQYRQALMHL